MPITLRAGVARRTINPSIGTAKVGQRLYGDPIESIQSDLTGTVCVVSDESSTVAIVALDLCEMLPAEASDIRRAIGQAIDTPASHVLLNMAHNHSCPALPGYRVDPAEQMVLKERYRDDLTASLVEAASEARSALHPARIGYGWGHSDIGIYRRETRPDGGVILGEVPDHPIDQSIGVVRIDDDAGDVIAVIFSVSCHAVVVGPRSHVATTDFPGPARHVIEAALGGRALFLQACGGNISPYVGIGYEVDGRKTERQVGTALGAETLAVAAGIRTDARQEEARQGLENVPGILLRPWQVVSDDHPVRLDAAEDVVRLSYGELPDLAQAERIHAAWRATLAEREAGEALAWELRVARWFTEWSRRLVDAARNGDPHHDVVIQALRIGDVVLAGISMEAFFETGMAVKERSPMGHTQVLGYTNGSTGYLPRAEDYPPGGWKLTEEYHVPDLYVQAYMHPVALHPASEQIIVERLSALIETLA